MSEDEEVRAEVGIKINGVEKDYEMVIRETYEIEDCEDGKIVLLLGHDGSQWTGRFRGTYDEDIILESLDNPTSRIALNSDGVGMYFEEIKEIPYAEEVKE